MKKYLVGLVLTLTFTSTLYEGQVNAAGVCAMYGNSVCSDNGFMKCASRCIGGKYSHCLSGGMGAYTIYCTF